MKKLVFAVVAATVFPFVAFASDRGALELLYDALSGDQWDNADGWLSEAPLDEWHGVVTRDGRVIRIELPDNHLTGQLPLGLEDLDELEVLDLRWNNIWGSIPESFGEIASLESLLLSGNELSGEIPWSVGSIQTLKRLDLSNNQLWGDIPSTLGDLQSLESLGLQHNQLTGPAPSELTRIRTMRRIILNDNNLTGALPSGVGEQSSRVHLQIFNNGPSISEYPESKRLDVLEKDLSQAGKITGLDMLNETTAVVKNAHASEFIRETMSAIHVHDGYLRVESAKLPQDVNAEQFQQMIKEINHGLQESGDRIYSVDDLERVFELYDGPSVIVPDPISSDQFDTMNFKANPVMEQGAESGAKIRQHLLRTIAAQQNLSPTWISCPNTKANNPHVSRTISTEIVGKSQVACRYGSGPAQTLSFSAFSYLQKWTRQWGYGYWNRVGREGPATEVGYLVSPGYSMRFIQNELVAVVTPCRTGTYRTRLALYIYGSVSGTFVPYPGLYASVARNLSC